MLSSLRDTCEFSACHMWGFCMSHVSSLRVTCEDAAPHLWGLWASHVTTLRLTFEDAAHHMGGLCTSHVKILRITCEDSAPHMSRDDTAPHMWRCCASHGRTRRLTCDDFAHHIWELWVTCEDSVSHITMAWGGRGRSSYRVGWRRCAEQICVFGLWLQENKWSIKRCYKFVKDNSWGYWDVKLEFFSLLMCFIFTHFMGQSGLQFGPGALC